MTLAEILQSLTWEYRGVRPVMHDLTRDEQRTREVPTYRNEIVYVHDCGYGRGSYTGGDLQESSSSSPPSG